MNSQSYKSPSELILNFISQNQPLFLFSLIAFLMLIADTTYASDPIVDSSIFGTGSGEQAKRTLGSIIRRFVEWMFWLATGFGAIAVAIGAVMMAGVIGETEQGVKTFKIGILVVVIGACGTIIMSLIKYFVQG